MEWNERAAKLRKEKRIPLSRFAEALDCTQSAISHWLTGRRKARFETILKFADVLQVPVTTLTGDKSNIAKNDLELAFLDLARSIPEKDAQVVLKPDCRYLIIDFGTPWSPKSIRKSDTG